MKDKGRTQVKMTKAERLLYLINLIRSHRNLTSKDLAEECGVSERTVFRDINSLASARFPIYYDHGYKFLEGAFLPTLNLSEDELSALKFAFEFSPMKTNSTVLQLGRSILSKLEAGRRKPESERSTGLNHPTTVESTSGNGTDRFFEACKLLHTAIAQRKVVKIRYKKNGNHIADTLIEPLALLQGNLRWQVLCFCYECRKMASYDLAKVEEISLTAQSFQSKMDLENILAIHR
jgi:predicted DNA-binding transcriptional regulator YafY